MTRTRLPLAALLAVALTFGVAACGGDDENSADNVEVPSDGNQDESSSDSGSNDSSSDSGSADEDLSDAIEDLDNLGDITGMENLDECLAMVAAAPRPKMVQSWVVKLAGIKRLKHRVAEGLCKKGILRAAEDRVLGIFNRKVYPETDPGPERRLVERLREAVLSDSQKLDPRTVVLVSLSRHSGLLLTALTRKEIKARKERLAQIENGDAVGKAVKGAIDAMNAAIMTAAIIPAICAASN